MERLITLRAKRYESVELHSRISPTILKLIPVSTGLVSSWDAAKDVWLTISLNTSASKTIFFLRSSKDILGYSFLFIPFKLNSLLSV